MDNTAVIDLKSLEYNATLIKNRLPQGVRFCAVVKADAYGHGACECAKALYRLADCFAVALVDEGVALRLSGIDKPILVLIPAARDELDRAIDYGLTLTVSSVSEVNAVNKAAGNKGAIVEVHIAFNSGMNRLGVDSGELPRLIRALKGSRYLRVGGFFSHYACPENDRLRKAATKKFNLSAALIKNAFPNAVLHISSSGGFLKGEYFDMVRIGILLYGYKPFQNPFPVKPVMKVYARRLIKRRIKKGELALYGDQPAEKDCEYTVVRAGYADGLFRQKTDGLINNRCMDTSGVTGNFNGVIMGNAEKTAKSVGTISYEILCAASSRAEKKYIR